MEFPELSINQTEARAATSPRLLIPKFVLKVLGVPRSPLSNTSPATRSKVPPAGLTAGKKPAVPSMLLTSEIAVRSFPFLDSMVRGPKDPRGAPSSARMSVVRKKPLLATSRSARPMIAPLESRAVRVTSLSALSRLTTTSKLLKRSVPDTEGTSSLVPHATISSPTAVSRLGSSVPFSILLAQAWKG
jgi:hypothetical protein